MGKNKLQRWADLGTLGNVVQPESISPETTEHNLKGKWKSEFFRNNNPIVLELACGKGEYTVGLAELIPEFNFIGIDIKGARMWRGARTANDRSLKNAAFLRTRIEFIDGFFGSGEADEMWIVFPDPHSDKKNSNKRLTCPWFLNIYRKILKDKGIIHLKTDNAELFRYTDKLVSDNGLELLYSTGDLHSAAENERESLKKAFVNMLREENEEETMSRILSITTHYEKGFLKEGRQIYYMAFRLEKNKNISHGWEKTI